MAALIFGLSFMLLSAFVLAYMEITVFQFLGSVACCLGFIVGAGWALVAIDN